MMIDQNGYRRRDFLKSAAGAVAATLLYSNVATAGEDSKGAFKFVQLCDTQLGFGGYGHDLKAFRQAVRQINAAKPDFVVICGDLVDVHDEKSFADFIEIKAGLTVPCHCAPGNHDVGNNPTPESLQYYRDVIGKDYYSFEHKGYLFAVVNTQLWKTPIKGESEKHDSWLDRTLQTASDKSQGVVIVGHHPLFIKKPDESEAYYNLPPAKRRELLSLFEQHGVVAVLGGHTHKFMANEYKDIQLVNGETTSRNFDGRPRGFRIWQLAGPRPFKHEFIPLKL